MAALSPASWLAKSRQRFWRLAPADRGEIVLRHRRIYILPTPRGLAIIATLAIMLLTSMNYALSLGYALTFVAGGLVAAALLATFRNMAGVAASPLVAGEAFAGGELSFTIMLASGNRPRVGLGLRARSGAEVAIELPANATRPVALTVSTERRGVLPLGRVTLASDYPLGLWRGWAYVHFPLDGHVYPAPEASPPPLPARAQGTDANRSAQTVDAELGGVREYQRGDSQNRIAWKAVARGAGWYTKQFEGGSGSGDVELAWNDLPPALDEESRLSRLAAWILAAEREVRPFALTMPGAVLAQGQGAGHRRAALTALALFESGQR